MSALWQNYPTLKKLKICIKIYKLSMNFPLFDGFNE